MMTSLIKVEFMKLKKDSKIIGALITFLAATFVIFGSMVVDKEARSEGNVWSEYVAANVGIIFIIVSIFSCIVVGRIFMGEYEKKTINILFTYPVSRTKIYISKIITASIYSCILTIFGTLITFLIDFIWNKACPIMKGTFNGKTVLTIAVFTLISCVFQSFFNIIYSFFSATVRSVLMLVLSCIAANNIINHNFLFNSQFILVKVIILVVCVIVGVVTVAVINRRDVC